MKKLFAILLAVAMIAALSVTAFAAEAIVTDFENDTEISVLGTFNDQYVQEYNVALTWGSMDFTYNTQVAAWNESTHLWETSGEEGWTVEDGENEITLVNHSSVEVVATFSYAQENTSGISGTFSSEEATAWADDAMTMPCEVNPDDEATEAYTAHEYVVALTLSNALDAEWAEGTAVGTITVELA